MSTSFVRGAHLAQCMMFAVVTVLLVVGVAHADPPANLAFTVTDETTSPDRSASNKESGRDPSFPGTGHVTISGATGIPFAAVGELALGTTDDFTLSAVGGVADTFDEYAVGGRARIAVFRHRPLSVVVGLPVLFYPPTPKRGHEPWILTNPSLVLSGRFSSGASIYGGVGALLASCTDGLAGHFSGSMQMENESGASAEETPMVDGAWNTVHAGGALPIGTTSEIFLESALVLSGIRPSQSYSEKIGPPVFALVGARRAF